MGKDIHKVDQGYSIARHILVALDDAGDDGLKADELGALLHASGSQVGAWLRDLRCREWTTKVPVSPGSYIVRWYITTKGRTWLNEREDTGKERSKAYDPNDADDAAYILEHVDVFDTKTIRAAQATQARV